MIKEKVKSVVRLPKKTKKITEEVEIKEDSQKPELHLIRDEEKCAVSIGLVFGIGYLLLGAFVAASPATAAMVLRAFTFGLIEITASEIDPRLLVVGLISAVMVGVVGGFFYAKIFNMVKKS